MLVVLLIDNIGQLSLLNKLYGDVIITLEILSEFGKQTPSWITVKSVKDAQKKKILELELDEGESSAISLCLEQTDGLGVF